MFGCVIIESVSDVKLLYMRMDSDIHELIEDANTNPFAFHTDRPGSGLGALCIPIDSFYLPLKVKELDSVFSMAIEPRSP